MFLIDEITGTITLPAGTEADGLLEIPSGRDWSVGVAGNFVGTFESDADDPFAVSYIITATGDVTLDEVPDFRLAEGDQLVNRGSVRSSAESGGALEIDGARIVNFGSIEGADAALIPAVSPTANTVFNFGHLSGSVAGAVFAADQDRLVNSGRIEGLEGPIGQGVIMVGDDSVLWNSDTGLIEGRSVAVVVSNDGTTIRNEGTIRQSGSDRDATAGVSLGGTNQWLQNTGLIEAEGIGVEATGDGIRVSNFGTIRTLDVQTDMIENIAVKLSGDGSVLRNGGVIEGKVDFGDGDERYLGADGSIDAGIFLGAGDDVAEGGTGDERILGQRGNDRIEGRGGKDDLLGGGGDDRISGGAGVDEITGGRGNDRMEGGTGADVFVFGLRSDDDVILDFEGRDRLDLTALAATEEAVRAAAAETAAGVVLDLDAVGGDGQVLLAGVALDDLGDGFLL